MKWFYFWTALSQVVQKHKLGAVANYTAKGVGDAFCDAVYTFYSSSRRLFTRLFNWHNDSIKSSKYGPGTNHKTKRVMQNYGPSIGKKCEITQYARTVWCLLRAFRWYAPCTKMMYYCALYCDILLVKKQARYAAAAWCVRLTTCHNWVHEFYDW